MSLPLQFVDAGAQVGNQQDGASKQFSHAEVIHVR